MSVDAKTVMKLRRETGAGMMDCKKALVETEGNFDKAKDLLRAKGMKDAAKKGGRKVSHGVMGVYVHHDKKLAALVEVLCETDFVAMNEKFQELARSLAMHCAAANPAPQYLTRDEVPADIVEREAAIFREQVKDKPEQIQDKIVAGKLDSFFAECVLLDQEYAMDKSMGSINDVLTHAKSKAGFGENTVIRRFSRWSIGDDIAVPGGEDADDSDE
jgi:elongation factor Ts